MKINGILKLKALSAIRDLKCQKWQRVLQTLIFSCVPKLAWLVHKLKAKKSDFLNCCYPA